MSTSETYNFLSPESHFLIDQAYARIGIKKREIVDQYITDAQIALNLILQSWPNEGKNLWTIRNKMIGLVPNKRSYSLPSSLIDLDTVCIRNSTRQLGGTAGEFGGGDADNAFDGDSSTSCTQDEENGDIYYEWATAVSVSLVGIQSNVTQNYTILCQYFNGSSWVDSISIPIQSYEKGVIQWFEVPIPTSATSYMITETGGAILDIQELYFSNSITDLRISRFSQSDYTSVANKFNPGRPLSFYVDRQISPVLYLYPVPGIASLIGSTSTIIPPSMPNNLYFTYWNSLQDIGSMINSAEIPPRFLEALISSLAVKLALQNPDRNANLEVLNAMATDSFLKATANDRERVPLMIYPKVGYSRE